MPRKRKSEPAIVDEAGCERNAVIVRPGTGARFNFLEWEATRAGGGAGPTINTVQLLHEMAGKDSAKKKAKRGKLR